MIRSIVFRPDITEMVDWALKTNYLPTYLSDKEGECMSPDRLYSCPCTSRKRPLGAWKLKKADGQACRQTDRQADEHAGRRTGRQTQTDRQRAGRQADRQTGVHKQTGWCRQTDRHTQADRQTDGRA